MVGFTPLSIEHPVASYMLIINSSVAPFSRPELCNRNVVQIQRNQKLLVSARTDNLHCTSITIFLTLLSNGADIRSGVTFCIFPS